MPSDRLGNIRIKPDTGKTAPDSHDGEITTDHDATGLHGEQDSFIPSHRPTSQVTRGREFPFKPSRAMLWLVAPLFFVLLYGAGSYFLVPALIKGSLSKSLSDTLHRPVYVERVVFSPFSLRVFLTDISVGPVYGDVNKQNLFECSGFQCRLDFSGLFHRQLVCHEVKVNGVSLNLLRLRLGSFNIADAAHFFSLLKERRDMVLWPAWLVLDGVHLTDSYIIIDDDLAKKQHRIEQISFYFPSAEEARAEKDILPSLNAVINSSPVHIDGRRQKNAKGDMETRFTLKFSEVVLKNYLDYLPALRQSPFELAGGQADIDVDLVIPELSDGEQKVSLQLNAAVKALDFQDQSGEQVLKVPEARFEVQALPQTKQYIIKDILFTRPEFTFTLSKSSGEKQSGVSFSDLKNFVQDLDTYPYGIRCEKFTWKNGKLRLSYGRQGKSSYIWNDVELMLSGYVNETSTHQVEKNDEPALFSFSGKAESDDNEMRFSAEGKIHPAWQIDGSVAVSNLDLKQYSRFLPANISFAQGRADLESSFSLTETSNDKDARKKQRFSLLDGRLTMHNFTFLNKKREIISGKRLDCLMLQADVSGKHLSCDKLLMAQGDIYGDRVRLADLQKGMKSGAEWTISTHGLEVTGATLHKQIHNPFNIARPLQLEINNFSMHADSLQSEAPEQDNFTASGRIGKKGELTFAGTYSPVSGEGQLRTSLKDTDVHIFKQYVAPWFIPELKSGKLNAEGTCHVPEKEFTGTIHVDNLQAGQPEGPYVSWKEAVSQGVQIRFDPFLFRSEKIELQQPIIIPGISHAEKTISMFLRPLQDKAVSGPVTIKTVHFENGTFDLPEPVILQGYQPKLTDISGTVSSVGSGVMPFTIGGGLDEHARFTVKGSSEIGQVNDYTLEVSDFPLGPFQTILSLSKNAGIEARSATGSWRQDMSLDGKEMVMSNRIRLQNIRPNPGSVYFRVISMYVDDRFSLDFASDDRYEEGEDRPFLLDLLIRGLRYDAIKAELSERLILNRLLPDLNLPGTVSFTPGSSILSESGSLSDYAELLKIRPFLRLELAGNYDPESDTSELQEIVRKEADLFHETEKKRLPEESLKIVEREKGGTAQFKNDPKRIVEEKMSPVELSRDLQPLPSEEVKVETELLLKLAKERAQAVYNYFVDQLSLQSDRVVIASQTGASGPNVIITVQPFYFETETQTGSE